MLLRHKAAFYIFAVNQTTAMLSTSMLPVRHLLTRLNAYWKNYIAHWNAQLQHEVASASTVHNKHHNKDSHFKEKLVLDYAFFVDRTLFHYMEDMRAHSQSINHESILQRCVWLMRKEMDSEAERICKSLRTSTTLQTMLKCELRRVAEKAVFYLEGKVQSFQSTIH